MSYSGGNKTRGRLITAAFGLIPVLWAALLAAPYLSSGLLGIITGLTVALQNPFDIRFNADTPRTVLIFVLAYAFGIGIWLSSIRNTRPGEEHGSASLGNARELNAKYADHYKYRGRLPIPVHFLMDEFANIALPDDFEKILSTCRSRAVSCSIIIQNIAQLKALFDKQWESIIGNCDEFIYLGGNEQATHEYVSKLLGKETIGTDSHGRVHGPRGNYSTKEKQTCLTKQRLLNVLAKTTIMRSITV